jgi:hypothetical protein
VTTRAVNGFDRGGEALLLAGPGLEEAFLDRARPVQVGGVLEAALGQSDLRPVFERELARARPAGTPWR